MSYILTLILLEFFVMPSAISTKLNCQWIMKFYIPKVWEKKRESIQVPLKKLSLLKKISLWNVVLFRAILCTNIARTPAYTDCISRSFNETFTMRIDASSLALSNEMPRFSKFSNLASPNPIWRLICLTLSPC